MVRFSNKGGCVIHKCMCIKAIAGLGSWAIDNWLQLISNAMLFKIVVPLRIQKKKVVLN